MVKTKYTVRKTQNKLPPKLKTPIKLNSISLGNKKLSDFLPEKNAQAQHSAEQNAHAFREIIEKMGLLLDYYEIPRQSDERWFNLSLRMAHDYIPGFRLVQKRTKGAKEKWNPSLQLKLFNAVQTFTNGSKTRTQAMACNSLINQEPWKSLCKSAKSLRTRYTEAAKSPLVNFIIKIKSDGKIKNENIESLGNLLASDKYALK